MMEDNYCRKCKRKIFVGNVCFDCKDLLDKVEREENSDYKVKGLMEFDE